MKTILLILFFITFNYLNCSANELNLEHIDTDSDNFILWAALFSLGLIGIIVLFFSSESMRNYQKKEKKKKEEEKEYNKLQGEIISDMTKNIQNIAQETVSNAHNIYKKDEQSNISIDIKKVVSSEKKLLSITTNLIEFLRIKSRKIEIFDEKFILSNLLNDITGILKEAAKDIELNLIYDVKKDIPEYLNGDTLNLSKIIVNLAVFCVEHDAREIIIEVSKDTRYSQTDNLYFKIISFIDVDVEDNSNLFNSNYNETTNNYDSLSLFVAKELSILMDGDIITKNNKDGSVEFTFYIPFKEHPHSKMFKTDDVKNKNIYLLDLSPNTTKAISNMLNDLQHSVKIDTKENCLINIPDFTKYDLVIIDEKILTFKIIEALKKSETKIISLSNTFKLKQQYPISAIVDMELNKPITRKQLTYNINNLFRKPEKELASNKKPLKHSSKLLVHRTLFENAKNITLNSFSQFRDAKVLIVEDNLINQKVAVSLLHKSRINIAVAADGKEALDILHDSGKEFDIVFMDINMPVMDGYVSTKMIRANEKFNNLPIVALSALTSPDEIDEMFSCGMNGYLAKPLKISRFFTAFATFLEKKDEIITPVIEEVIIHEFDGLNIEQGIDQASNSDIFYKEILLEFKDAYGDSADVFEKLVNNFRFEQLRMLCLDLKGLSGSIGAKDMNELVTEVLLRLINKKYELMPIYIEPFKKELNRVKNSIELYAK